MSETRLKKHSYQVIGKTSDQLRAELNSIFTKISLRLDQLDAIAQNPDMKGRKIVNVGTGEVSSDGATTGQAEDPLNERITRKNAASGYAGLNASSRVTKGADTTDDLIVDMATKGLVLKDSQATPHYWRVTANGAGNVDITDIGTTKP